MPVKHARLSASSAFRWINCPGSVALAEQFPPPPESPYAAEGTTAHSLAELKLRMHCCEIEAVAYENELAKIKAGVHYSGEMEEAVDFYIDTVMEHLAAAGPNAELLTEQQLSLTDWVPEGFGTADAVIIGDGAIEVIDLKYGKGVRVEARGNPQLRLYGLGASSLFSGLYDFNTVRTTIIQPRLDHIGSDEISLEELRLWAEKVIVPQARMAMDNTGYTACGEWCRFCPAKSLCRKRAEYNLEMAKHTFKNPPLLSDEEIGEILTRADDLQRWAGDVQEYALQQALAGKHYEGWKLVEGRSVRKYSDEIKVAETLKAAGFDEALLYERKLYGITAMEKLVGKKRFAETLGGLIVKPAGKPVLVPESDKREAIHSAEAAKADFDDDIIPQF